MSGKITIDGVEIPFAAGQTIMEAAADANIYIPHLCHHSKFSPQGNCRLCNVKVDGKFAAACHTEAQDGADIENNGREIKEKRIGILAMLFVEGNHICPGCEKSGECKLQSVAYYCGLTAPEFPYLFPQRKIDGSHPDFIIEFNRCILCGLCVQASEHDGKNVFVIAGRGIDSYLAVNSPDGKLGSSSFAASDRAADICPVGAILPKNQGFKTPIGSRLYDLHAIGGNRKKSTN